MLAHVVGGGAQARGISGIGGECGGGDACCVEGLEIVGMPVGAAGNQRDGVPLPTESMCDGHAEAWTGADYENHGSRS